MQEVRSSFFLTLSIVAGLLKEVILKLSRVAVFGNPTTPANAQSLIRPLRFLTRSTEAEGKVDRLPNLAEELVRLNVDVIWALGPAVAYAKNATKTIPIVITHVGDPVGSGLVASLAHPGGNITGLSGLAPELGGKRSH